MEKTFKTEILSALSKPSTVTEIKRKTPRIKSFGTIAYHLKKLEHEGIITKEKQKKKQGQPTIYSITSRKVQNKFKQYNKEKEKYLGAFLKVLIQKPNISDDEIMLYLEKDGYDVDFMSDISMDSIQYKYSIMEHKITKKGLKFLKQPKKEF